MMTAMTVQVTGLETIFPFVRLLAPSATRKIAEPMLAAIPQTSAKRQIQSIAGDSLSASRSLRAGKSMEPMEYFLFAL